MALFSQHQNVKKHKNIIAKRYVYYSASHQHRTRRRMLKRLGICLSVVRYILHDGHHHFPHLCDVRITFLLRFSFRQPSVCLRILPDGFSSLYSSFCSSYTPSCKYIQHVLWATGLVLLSLMIVLFMHYRLTLSN